MTATTTVGQLVAQATAAGLDAADIAIVIAFHAPELAARMESLMSTTNDTLNTEDRKVGDLKVGQHVLVARRRYLVAAVASPGDWDDALVLVPEGTPLLRVGRDLVDPSFDADLVPELRSL